MTTCECDGLPELFYLDEAPAGWLERLSEEAAGNWKTLRQCGSCGRRFAVDAWDKYQHQVVVRVKDRAGWEAEADAVDKRKILLLQSRGGTQGGECVWVGCARPRVRGVAYCLDHLWDSGARR
jgi:hypothetical protein